MNSCVFLLIPKVLYTGGFSTSGVSHCSPGVDYKIIKSTAVYLLFVYVDNQDNITADMSGGGRGDRIIVAAGEDPYGAGLGLLYKF